MATNKNGDFQINSNGFSVVLNVINSVRSYELM